MTMLCLALGAFTFTTVWAVGQFLLGGYQYVRSNGDTGRMTAAKNRIIYHSMIGLIAFPASLPAVTLVGSNGVEMTVGFGLAGLLTAVRKLVLRGNSVPKAVATYSALWMPEAERTEHRQDMLYALTQARPGRRSHHAWALLKSSPRAGLRARRHHARLDAALTDMKIAGEAVRWSGPSPQSPGPA
ncbi:hypothetical protein [Streptomyces sp. NPDC002187]|uniref:hypothetical protein n=1 Tax=Streptomyces sp. NPDC002187 TaxID=3364637 RepID=UPI0036AD5822